jgi:hypothetical protein
MRKIINKNHCFLFIGYRKIFKFIVTIQSQEKIYKKAK